MTGKAQHFVQANCFSPVVYAAAVAVPGHARPGMLFRLENDKTFKLSPVECRMITPRWAYEEPAGAR